MSQYGSGNARFSRRQGMIYAAIATQAFAGWYALPARADVSVVGDTSAIMQNADGTWHDSGEMPNDTFYVGITSIGSMFVNGATFISPPHDDDHINFPSASIGSAEGANGGVVVSNKGAWVTSGLLEVGEFGTGSFNINTAGTTEATDMAAGGQSTGNGTINVSGAGSTLTVTDNLLIGNFGTGALNVSSGAAVIADFPVIGGDGVGTATFDKSTFTITDDLIVGGANNGSLTVQNGSSLSANNITLGDTTDGNGTMNLDGSNLSCTNQLTVGYDYYSTENVFNIFDGSQVTTGDLEVGLGGIGTVVVGGTNGGRSGTPDQSGLQSTLNAGVINIGGGQFDRAGVQSAIYVINGSLVTSGDVSVGGVDGFASIQGFSAEGLRSTWNAGDVSVSTGDLGGGLSVSEGGLLTSTSGIIDDGFAVVDGVGGSNTDEQSTWNIDGPLLIGSTTGERNETLAITNGGLVTAGDVTLGDSENATGTGILLIDGVGGELSQLPSTLQAGHVLVGNGYDGYITISNGGVLSCKQLDLGNNFSNGYVDLTDPGSMLDTNDNSLNVGNTADGTLTVQNGATLTAESLHIGGQSEANGTAIFDGQFTTGTISGAIFVGESGTGEMDITNGAMVFSNTGFVGTNTNSFGTLVVSGAGSTWTDTNYLTIGTYGNGTVTISDGGQVSAGNISVGQNPGGIGSVSVDAGTLTTPTSLEVGQGGQGTLMAMNVSTVSADTLTVGDASTGVGSVSLNGNGTTGTFTTSITVGNQGIGTLSFSNLATASTKSLVIASQADSTGVVRISDFVAADTENPFQQTTLTVNGDVAVSQGGQATLTVQNGGLLKSVNGLIADAGGNGTVSITGDNSTWMMSGNLTIGGVGQGAVNVDDGGVLSAAALEIGRLNNGTDSASASDGSLTITHGVATFTGAATIGDGGVGVMASSGTLSTANVIVGNQSTATGAVSIQGGTWNLGSLILGEAGTGGLTILDGKVTPQSVTIGDAANSQGALVIGNGGLTLSPNMIVAGALTVGSAGSGSITLNSGNLTAGSLTLGSAGSSSGIIHDLSGATLQIAGGLVVGGAGSGDLEIQSGGHALAVSVTVGSGAGSAQLNIGGNGSTLTTFNGITIGAAGSSGDFTQSDTSVVSAATTSVGTPSLAAASVGMGQLTVRGGRFNAGKLTVAGGSSLLIQQGGDVTATAATLGSGHFLSAQIKLTDPGSTLDCGTAAITLGGLGAADLELDNLSKLICKSIAVHVAGTLQGDGGTVMGDVLNDGGTVHPGDSPGTLTIAGDYTQTDGLMDVEFSGKLPSEMDLLEIQGDANLTGGMIDFTFLNGYVPQPGDSLTFLTAASIEQFSGVTYQLIGVPDTLAYSVNISGNSLQLNVTSAVPEPSTLGLVLAGSGMLLRRRRH